MKKLVYIPIIHTQTDIGSLSNTLSSEGVKKFGQESWQDHVLQVDLAWKNIESEIERQIEGVLPEKIKIYQDGLPVADETGVKIVKDVAAQGSINYQIIDNLLSLGAKLEQAENKEYLLKEYNLLSDIAKAGTPENTLKAYILYQDASEELLNDRDTFIANQINATLKDNETGIAFFGAAHSIIAKLNSDIEVLELQLFTDEISLTLMKR